ncbi:MAG: DNA gyrase subunit A [bacterium]|nr:DNA gyrase subunit A [bacterium]
MRESYLDYAMSVIVSRALPDVRDGLKPVHRRILYAMHGLGLASTAKFRKSAAIVGETLGNYHPHGDSSVYEAMVKMAQDFYMRYPLVIGQGNFGCFTGDTKVRLTDGRSLSFLDLIKEQEKDVRHWTFAFNTKTGRMEVAEVTKPRLTRKDAELVEVTLDNGEKIRCTPDHRFMLRSGVYRQAELLEPGDSLMPVYTEAHDGSDDAKLKGYTRVLQPRSGEWVSVYHLDGIPRFEKAVEYFGSVQEARQYNHKIVSVKALSYKEDVYDITIEGLHNFALDGGVIVHNSIDGDSAAAHRYTEAKMSKIAGDILHDIDKDTVDFTPNYDGTKKEPVVLPAAVPNLLLNGTLGIAVGMATKIPPHNLSELIDALMHLIEHSDATTEDIMQFIKGPDFPTGGLIFNEKDIMHASATGRGGVVARGEAEIVEGKNGASQIIITSLPYQVNKAEMIKAIADRVRDKQLEGIRDIRDESTSDIRVVIELKQGTFPQKVLNHLYKHSQLEQTFNYNIVALVDGVPRTLSIKAVLEEFLKYRIEVVTRRTKFDLAKAQAREHILLGLKKALDHIDEIIKTIKASKDTPTAHANLMKSFKFSQLQASAILEMKLQRLAGLERKKIEDELKEVQKTIAYLMGLLKDPKKMRGVVKEEFLKMKELYGDDRRTKVIKHGAKEIKPEDMVAEEENVLVLTSGGYIKRTSPSEYRAQNRGGVGVIDLDVKEEDFIVSFLTANTHDDMLFFSDRGKAYKTKMYELPEGKRATRGKSVMNFLQLEDGEVVGSILPMPKASREKSCYLLMVTKHGVVKKVAAEQFKEVRRNGLIAINLQKDDELYAARLVEKGQTIMIVTRDGQSIHFKESDARAMGRTASGVRAIKLRKGDEVVGVDVVVDPNNAQVMVISSKGYGKRTKIGEYKVQGRGGSGIKTANVTDKTGAIVTGRVVTDEHEELIAISKQAQVIRTGISQIPTLSRATQGVRIMKLRTGDSIASLTLL